MKKYKYRTKHVPALGWFAQVNKGWLRGWKTIGAHKDGLKTYYIEHSECHYKYPLRDAYIATRLIQEYAKENNTDYWFITYHDVDL